MVQLNNFSFCLRPRKFWILVFNLFCEFCFSMIRNRFKHIQFYRNFFFYLIETSKKYILSLKNDFNSIFITAVRKPFSKLDILDSIDSKRFNRQDPSCSENYLKIENSIQWQCRITPRYLQEIKFNGKFNFSSSRLLPPSFFITFTSFSILFLGIIAQWGQFFYEVDFDITYVICDIKRYFLT